MKEVKEGKAIISVHKGKISRKLPVFYNPDMKLNRDISILLLKSVKDAKLKIADPLAASGIRSIRFLKEINAKIEEIHINDIRENFPKTIKSNFKKNKIKLNKKIFIHNEEANLFLIKNKPFDYIDIDPFGTPNPFLDNSVKSLNKKGILAVTATDTSSLCGTYKHACRRKYWAEPLHNHMMQEIGLRILIRKVQMIAGQYEKALFPVLSYSKQHYMRVFFRCEKGKQKVDKIIAQHKHFNSAGPLWTGNLCDSNLLKHMMQNSKNKEINVFLYTLKSEEEVGVIGFYDIHAFAKKNKLKALPKKRDVIFLLKKQGYKASETNFCGFGVRSNIKEKEFLNLLKKYNKNKKPT